MPGDDVVMMPAAHLDMVLAVDYLFRHEQGDESRPPPVQLQMFDKVQPCAGL